MNYLLYWQGPIHRYLRPSCYACHHVRIHYSTSQGRSSILSVLVAPSQTDLYLIKHLGSQIPIVLLPSSSHLSISPHSPSPPGKKHTLPKRTVSSLSHLQPQHPQALRASLFRSPETLAALRVEGVERFFRWREVSRVLGSSSSFPFSERITSEREDLWVGWTASEREEWEGRLSYDVAAVRERARALGEKEAVEKVNFKGRDRDDTVTQRTFAHPHRPSISPSSTFSPPCSRSCLYSSATHISFDPLHFPSLVMFGLSLFRPAVSKQLKGWRWKWRWEVGVALVGGFCLGMLVSSR